jgi:hypothetical protein
MPEFDEKPSFQNLWVRIAAQAASGRNVTLSPTTALWVAREMMTRRQVRGSDQADFIFAVEQWAMDDSHIEEVVAQCRNAIVARAAFTAAVEFRPKSRLYLRSRAMIMERYEPPQEGDSEDAELLRKQP